MALADDVPVGFALVETLAADLAHLQELGVHPAMRRRDRPVLALAARSVLPIARAPFALGGRR